MEYYNNILCISHAELTDGIVSIPNYKLMAHRGKIRVVRRGCYGTAALVAFDSLPEHIKKECLLKHGNPREHAVGDTFKGMIEEDGKAWQFFNVEYLLADGRFLPQDVQKLYYQNAVVLNAINRIVNDRKALIRALGGNVKHIWDNITATCNALKVELGHDLPENPRRLRNKLADYKKHGYVSLVSGKWLNRNAAKVNDVEQEALLRQLFRKHNNLDNEQICSLYNIVAEKVDWDNITASTVANYREKWDMQTVGGRRGEIEFDNTRAMIVKRKAPTLPMIYWTSDGWEAELLYQKTEQDAKGNTRTTYHNRLTMVTVIDPCCKYPIGYAIGTHETPELIREAFRNAVNHTGELFGTRHKVHQLQTDNYGKKTLLPMYEGMSEKYTPARVHNAKSKVIEPFFLYLNKKYCQMMPNWSGFGITAKKENQPNAQYLNKIRSSFPDETGCRLQLERIIQMDRELKCEKYVQAYQELPQEDRLLMNDQEYLLNMGESTGYTNRLSASGLVVTLNGEKHEFDSYDVKFRQFGSIDWTVKYDPNDTRKVLAINQDASIRFELTEKYVQPMALYDRQDGDSEQLQLVRGFNRTLKADIMEGVNEDRNVVEELFQNNLLEGTLTKLILCDSNGQHKDNKNAARLNGKAVKLLEKQNVKIEKEAEKSWSQEQEEYLSKKVNLSKYINQ